MNTGKSAPTCWTNRLARKFLVILYYLGYTVAFAGFLFDRSTHHPILFGYSVGQWLMFILLLTFYGLPTALRSGADRWGGRRLVFALLPSLVFLVAGYAAVSLVYFHCQRRPFDPYVQTTSAPLPDLHDTDPAADHVRILVLGGSTSQHYPDVLLPLLRRKYPGVTFELVNEAMGFYTVKHSLINFTTYYDDYRPDLVLCLHGINELTRSFNPPDYALGPYNDRWAHFYGAAIQAAAPPPLEQLVLRRVAATWFRELRVHEVDLPLERCFALVTYVRHTERLLATLKTHGATAVVLTQPTLWRDGPMTPDEQDKLCFQQQMCVNYTDYFHQEYPTVASLARAMAVFNWGTADRAAHAGVLCIDAAAALPRDLDHFTDDCHFTQRGLDVLADTVADALMCHHVIEQVLEQRHMPSGSRTLVRGD